MTDVVSFLSRDGPMTERSPPADRPPGAPEPSAQRSPRRPKRLPAARTCRRN